jgi:hypothetical protein
MLACAASLGGLALSKASAVLIVPMAALMVPAALLLNRELVVALPGRIPLTIRSTARRLLATSGALLLCALLAWAAVWAAFGCRYAPVPPAGQADFQHYLFPGYPVSALGDITDAVGTPGKVLGWAGRHRLLPEAFLYGSAYVLASAQRYGFLNGALSLEGWRLFFPYCFLVKSTLPLLLLLATALVLPAAAWLGGLRNRAVDPLRTPGATAPLWILLAVYVPALMFSSINIGARHLLPLYPAICILLGGLATRLTTTGLRWWLLILLCWHIGEGVRGYPHYLAYFNQITGRRQAYRHLVDSSLDWGQDLPGLKSWLDQRRSQEPQLHVYLSYFGTGEPEYYGIAAEPLDLGLRSKHGLPATWEAGAFCVSATQLQTVYHPIRGRWNARYEQAYQELRANAMRPERIDSRKLAGLAGGSGESNPLLMLNQLGTARLLAFLREREPEVEIGYSILCYELTQADVTRALSGPPPEMTPPIPHGG